MKYEDIERMIRNKTSLKVIWGKWSVCNWQNLLMNHVGALVMWQLFHNHVDRYDEFFGDDGSSDMKEAEGNGISGVQNINEVNAVHRTLKQKKGWIEIDINGDVEDFEYEKCLYRVMNEGGGREQWSYSTSVAKKSITIRICQGNQLGAIHSDHKNQWVGYNKGNWGNLIKYIKCRNMFGD